MDEAGGSSAVDESLKGDILRFVLSADQDGEDEGSVRTNVLGASDVGQGRRFL